MIATPPPTPWWQVPEWLTALWTAALCLSGLLFWLIDHYLKRRERYLRICRADTFDPQEIVGAPNARGFSDYLPATEDGAISLALRDGESIGLRGRPGIGKSHSAAFHIRSLGLLARGERNKAWWFVGKILSRLQVPGFRNFRDWYVIRPLAQELQAANQVRVRKRRYVLLLDDLNDYVRNDDATAVLDLISTLRSQSRQLIVISTLRSTAPEELSVSSVSKIFGRWKWIDLPNWSQTQGERLAQKCGVGLDKWDGTPLSVKQPSAEMANKYGRLVLEKHAAASILRCLLLFREHGLSSVPRTLLKSACATEIFNIEPGQFESALTVVNRFGFLKNGMQFIEAYGPYLDTIEDWSPAALDGYLVIRDLLVEERRIPELETIAWAWTSRGKFAEAEWICRKCIELARYKPPAYLTLGVILRKQRDYTGAEAAFSSALRLDPSNLRARSLLAGIWTKLGRIDDAEKAYGRVLLSAPQMFEAVLGFGILLMKKADFAGAEQKLRKALQIRPESARAMGFLAESLNKLNRDDEAGEWYRAAIDIDPRMLELRLGYASLLLENKDYAQAEREAGEAVSVNPKSAAAHALLGQSFRGLGRLREAEESLRMSVSLNSSSLDTNMALGIVLADAGKHEHARDAFLQALAQNPKFARGYSYLAEQWAMLGNPDKSEECYATAISLDPEMQAAFTGLGMTLLKKGDYAGAERAFVRALEIAPGTPWVYARLADALRRQEKYDEADEMNRKGLSADPELLDQRLRFGIRCLQHSEPKRAEVAFRDVLSFDPDNLDACSRLAEALVRQGKLSELELVVATINQLDPQAPSFYLGPGMAALGCEQWAQAERFFRKAIAVDRNHARAYQHLGDALLNLGCTDEAADELRNAIQLNPRMSKAHYLRGIALFVKGDLRGAEASVRESVRIKPKFSHSHLLLGKILERRGHSDEAVSEYETALSLNPNLTEASDALNRIRTSAGV